MIPSWFKIYFIISIIYSKEPNIKMSKNCVDVPTFESEEEEGNIIAKTMTSLL